MADHRLGLHHRGGDDLLAVRRGGRDHRAAGRPRAGQPGELHHAQPPRRGRAADAHRAAGRARVAGGLRRPRSGDLAARRRHYRPEVDGRHDLGPGHAAGHPGHGRELPDRDLRPRRLPHRHPGDGRRDLPRRRRQGREGVSPGSPGRDHARPRVERRRHARQHASRPTAPSSTTSTTRAGG